jgi:hypothetical protein
MGAYRKVLDKRDYKVKISRAASSAPVGLSYAMFGTRPNVEP